MKILYIFLIKIAKKIKFKYDFKCCYQEVLQNLNHVLLLFTSFWL